MIPTRNTKQSVWRAALALCVLLFGVLAEPARLMMPPPDTCGMACCEASGVCYCRMAESADHDDMAEADDSTEAASVNSGVVNIGPSCLLRCGQIPAGFRKHSFANVNPPSLDVALDGAGQLFIHSPHFVRSALLADAHSPRAPPRTSFA